MGRTNTHELIHDANGVAFVRNLATGELMHSRIGPWEEANLIYISQSKLRSRLETATDEPLVIYDLGLGIAANAIATLDELARSGGSRKLHLVSVENDLTGLQLALEMSTEFPFLHAREDLLGQLLSERKVESPRLLWQLVEGDYLAMDAPGPAPDLVFYDFYSPKSSSELWTVAAFKKVFEQCAPKARVGHETQLLTYSAATAVRTALFLAGFHVGYGVSTDAKLETTLACTLPGRLENPLGGAWLSKFDRSPKAMPADRTEGDRTSSRQIIVARMAENPAK